MSEHKIPRLSYPGQPAPDEVFWLHDEATGRGYSIRDATSEMLTRHQKIVTQMHIETTKDALGQISILIGNCVKLASMKSVIDFELDRRKRKGGLVDLTGGALN